MIPLCASTDHDPTGFCILCYHVTAFHRTHDSMYETSGVRYLILADDIGQALAYSQVKKIPIEEWVWVISKTTLLKFPEAKILCIGCELLRDDMQAISELVAQQRRLVYYEGDDD